MIAEATAVKIICHGRRAVASAAREQQATGEAALMMRTRSRAMALVALAALAAGCGGAGSDTPPTTPTGKSAASGTGSGSGPGGSAAGAVGFDTVFRTEERFKQALPDPASMAGWTPQDASALIEEDPRPAGQCAADTDWECAKIARGDATFEAFGEEADFDITAFADQTGAQEACRKESTWSAKYTRAQVAAVPGVESHAYYRNVGGENGLYLTLCLGTVVAEVTLAGPNGSLDPATAHSLAQVFVPRIQKAAAAS
ncbi:hypothetical protein ACFU8I_04505 [Streptomyces sp. NPDC057540]|uniref:hypothetical protein n=1 Tax=Streptomyces sp. NPDC057540 TaxID=3346160 RepID=UPI0036CD9D9A